MAVVACEMSTGERPQQSEPASQGRWPLKRVELSQGVSANAQNLMAPSALFDPNNKSLKDWALRETASTHAVSAKVSALSRFRELFRLKPAFVIPISVTAMIVIAVAAVWLSSWREQQNRYRAIEQELLQLNTPSSLREFPPNMSSLDLSPVTVRSVEQETELEKPQKRKSLISVFLGVKRNATPRTERKFAAWMATSYSGFRIVDTTTFASLVLIPMAVQD
jgi:uncharacterized protein YggT (Ycf19 family)